MPGGQVYLCPTVLDLNGPALNEPALWHLSSGLPAYLQFAALLSLTLSTHPAKCLQIYLSLWLCVLHLIKLVHNTQFSAGPLLEHDNCSCWIDIVFVHPRLFVSQDWTIVICLCSALLWQSHTEPITAEQWRLQRDIKQARYWSWNTQKSINVSHWTPQEKTYFEVQEEMICVLRKSLHTVSVFLGGYVGVQLAVLFPITVCTDSQGAFQCWFKPWLLFSFRLSKAEWGHCLFCLDRITLNLLCTFRSV